jgi:hypothetical protein
LSVGSIIQQVACHTISIRPLLCFAVQLLWELDNGRSVGLTGVPDDLLRSQLQFILELLGLKCTKVSRATLTNHKPHAVHMSSKQAAIHAHSRRQSCSYKCHNMCFVLQCQSSHQPTDQNLQLRLLQSLWRPSSGPVLASQWHFDHPVSHRFCV